MEEPREMKYLPRPGDTPRGFHALAWLHNSSPSPSAPIIWGYHIILAETGRLGTPLSMPEEPTGLYVLFNGQEPCKNGEYVAGLFKKATSELEIMLKARITPLEVKAEPQDPRTTVNPRVLIENALSMPLEERWLGRGP